MVVSQWRAAAAVFIAALASFGAAAQAPSPAAPAQGTLRLIVPFTPGTGIDLIARTVGPKLGERLGRPVVVDNRTLYPQLPFDPVKDLVPVTLTSWGQLLLVASPRTGFKSVADLLAAARRRPGAINYASPGVGTPHHMSMELFKNRTGVFITHVPYRGTAQALTDLLGGQVDVMFLPIHVALPHVKA